eukprot:scaffold203074_cov19-Tisochrysis_lutea.AAC.2
MPVRGLHAALEDSEHTSRANDLCTHVCHSKAEDNQAVIQANKRKSVGVRYVTCLHTEAHAPQRRSKEEFVSSEKTLHKGIDNTSGQSTMYPLRTEGRNKLQKSL